MQRVRQAVWDTDNTGQVSDTSQTSRSDITSDNINKEAESETARQVGDTTKTIKSESEDD